jgi:hypothetical protein
MSIRAQQAGDNLLNATSIGVSTGDFSIGIGVKLMSGLSAYQDFVGIGSEFPFNTSAYAYLSLNDAGEIFGETGASPGAGPWDTTPGYAVSATTWYWVVLSRTGGTLRRRVWSYSDLSTTPLSDQTVADGSRDLSTCDNFAIGDIIGVTSPPDAEFCLAKVHIGVAWSDAQAKAESRFYNTQTGGGTWFIAAGLRNITADAYGINDRSGAGHHLTNTGMVNGASSPSILEQVFEPTGLEATGELGTAVLGVAPLVVGVEAAGELGTAVLGVAPLVVGVEATAELGSASLFNLNASGVEASGELGIPVFEAILAGVGLEAGAEIGQLVMDVDTDLLVDGLESETEMGSPSLNLPAGSVFLPEGIEALSELGVAAINVTGGAGIGTRPTQGQTWPRFRSYR